MVVSTWKRPGFESLSNIPLPCVPTKARASALLRGNPRSKTFVDCDDLMNLTRLFSYVAQAGQGEKENKVVALMNKHITLERYQLSYVLYSQVYCTSFGWFVPEEFPPSRVKVSRSYVSVFHPLFLLHLPLLLLHVFFFGRLDS